MDKLPQLIRLEHDFSVCKIKSIEQVNFSHEYVFVQQTPDEISLICETKYTPSDYIACEHGWSALKVSGILDFGLVGIIAKITNILAEAGFSIFVISTFNTDYILLKSDTFDRGVRELMNNGYSIN